MKEKDCSNWWIQYHVVCLSIACSVGRRGWLNWWAWPACPSRASWMRSTSLHSTISRYVYDDVTLPACMIDPSTCCIACIHMHMPWCRTCVTRASCVCLHSPIRHTAVCMIQQHWTDELHACRATMSNSSFITYLAFMVEHARQHSDPIHSSITIHNLIN